MERPDKLPCLSKSCFIQRGVGPTQNTVFFVPVSLSMAGQIQCHGVSYFLSSEQKRIRPGQKVCQMPRAVFDLRPACLAFKALPADPPAHDAGIAHDHGLFFHRSDGLLVGTVQIQAEGFLPDYETDNKLSLEEPKNMAFSA